MNGYTKAIFHLSSNNIFRNLAFEYTLYEQLQHRLRFLKNKSTTIPIATQNLSHALLLWRDSPCIVIGRHQCVWQEVKMKNLHYLTTILRERKEVDNDLDCIPVVRRSSGGGAVYHDMGNWCVSLLMPRDEFNRVRHMQWLAECVIQCRSTTRASSSTTSAAVSSPLVAVAAGGGGGGTDSSVSSNEESEMSSILPNMTESDEIISATNRGDITYDNYYKFSGSASKLASAAAFHHCTVLSQSNLQFLSMVLQPSFKQLTTRATSSVRSPVANVQVNDEIWLETLRQQYSRLHSCSSLDFPMITVEEGREHEFVDEKSFEENLKTFLSWEWNYGRSPEFSIEFPLFKENSTILHPISLSILCKRGRIDKLSLVPSAAGAGGATGGNNNTLEDNKNLNEFLLHVNSKLHNCPLTSEVKDHVSTLLRTSVPYDDFVAALYRALFEFSNQL